jgi:hypothetical protein
MLMKKRKVIERNQSRWRSKGVYTLIRVRKKVRIIHIDRTKSPKRTTRRKTNNKINKTNKFNILTLTIISSSNNITIKEVTKITITIKGSHKIMVIIISFTLNSTRILITIIRIRAMVIINHSMTMIGIETVTMIKITDIINNHKVVILNNIKSTHNNQINAISIIILTNRVVRVEITHTNMKKGNLIMTLNKQKVELSHHL